MGKKAGWMKIAQAAPQAQPQPQASPAPAPAQQAPKQSKSFGIIDQALKNIEMQANQMPLNGQKIRVLVSQIRQLAQTDSTAV